jgi:hypothetical protein
MSEEQIENKENKEEKNEILSEKNENLDEKNEISLNLNPMEIWDYNYCSNLDFSEKNLSTLKLKNKTKEDIEYFYSEIIHSAIHPSLKKLLINDENEILEKIHELKFINTKIDLCTIYFTFLILPKLKITSINFTNNHLTLNNFELILNELLEKPNNIYSFNFEWNEKIYLDEKDKKGFSFNNLNLSKENDNKIFTLLTDLFLEDNSKLEAISLRGCFIGNQTARKIFEYLKDNKNLIILNLFKNNLTTRLINNLGEMFLFNRTLEEINLGGNFFDDEAIETLKNFIGEFEMNENEIEEYNKILNEKNEAIEFNKKNKNNKKVALKEIPFVDEMKEENNKKIRVRNGTIQKIDFMGNKITQKSFDNFIFMIENTKNLIFKLDLTILNRESVLKLIDQNGKFFNRVLLYK